MWGTVFRYVRPAARERPVSRRVMRGFQPAHLRKLRKERGYSQGELARAAGIGTTTLYHWEAESKSPQVDLLARVAAALGASVEQLVDVPEADRYPGDWRVLRGMTQPQLGRATGLSTPLVGRVERGEIPLSDDVATRLAEALAISPTQLRAAYDRARQRPLGEPA